MNRKYITGVFRNIRTKLWIIVALLPVFDVALADQAQLLDAIKQSVNWREHPLPGKWKDVSADPLIVSQKETEPLFGFQPKRILVFCRGNSIYEASVVYMETGYNLNLWKKIAPALQADYDAAFDKMKTDLPAQLEQITGGKGTPVTVSANAPNFSFNVVDYTYAGLVLRLYIEDRKSICLFISKPGDATTNLLRITSPEQRRQTLASNVARNPNGDVLITHIPVIDQDGRPYCGPATWTEIARYYGLEIFQEMMLSDRRDGGKGIDEAAGITKVFTKDFDFEQVQKSINSGNPIWFEEHGHVALITGYNATQNEVFRTDSWGEGSQNKRVALDKFLTRALGYMYFVP